MCNAWMSVHKWRAKFSLNATYVQMCKNATTDELVFQGGGYSSQYHAKPPSIVRNCITHCKVTVLSKVLTACYGHGHYLLGSR